MKKLSLTTLASVTHTGRSRQVIPTLLLLAFLSGTTEINLYHVFISEEMNLYLKSNKDTPTPIPYLLCTPQVF